MIVGARPGVAHLHMRFHQNCGYASPAVGYVVPPRRIPLPAVKRKGAISRTFEPIIDSRVCYWFLLAGGMMLFIRRYSTI
jgi:hypothetical protein